VRVIVSGTSSTFALRTNGTQHRHSLPNSIRAYTSLQPQANPGRAAKNTSGSRFYIMVGKIL
jgi:hypothetical protein